MLIAPSGGADPTSAPGETAEGVFGEGTTGHGQPDSKTGAMTWTYPFNLPAARGRPQPRLTLSYNSSSRDREAGYGWGLDLPVIERKPLSGNPCFTQDGTPIACGEQRLDATGKSLLSEERYTYNGQPLVFICQLPGSQRANDPDCGKEPQPGPPISRGWRYFRLQVEGQFSRFYLSENRRYWRVQLKGGELLEFGERPNSGALGIEHAFGNKNAVLRWRLVRHSDAVHKVSGAPVNYIDYRWKRLGKRGLLYLTDIYDTPRANGGPSYADFAHHTQLTWQSPDFPQTFYADPYRATPDLRLSRVAVASMPWSGIGPREVIRTYLLGYAAAQGATSTVALSQVFQLWHHSFLSGIGMEGRCGQFEDAQGNIPPDRSCQKIYTHGFFPEGVWVLPPTTFEYEDGFPAFGLAKISKVQGGPSNAVDENRVLPYLYSVGVVDFNRDGLPDIVQGWSSQLKNARPMIGYLNRGSLGPYFNLAYQCMDAGAGDDLTGLTYYNLGRAPGFPGFFTNTKGAATLVTSWGEGVVAWSHAQYAPYRATPQHKTSEPSEFKPGTGCDADHFKESDFHPGWKWEKTQADWAKPPVTASGLPVPTGGHGRFFPSRWFTDIDGDGLVDELGDTGSRADDFNVARVGFTRRYTKNDRLPGGDFGPAQIPFSSYYGLPASLVPSPVARSDTKFFYVDINGDGLVDLVTYNPNDSGGVPRVRPGDGHGHFWCENSRQPWPCKEWPTEPSPAYEIEALGSRMPWPFNEETFFHDVTADGLADIVQYDMASGDVRLWVNQDGHTFACVIESCVAGSVFDERTSTFNIGDHRTTFADMNADGIDDIVFLTKQGAYVGTFMKKYVYNFERGTAPRPGLLTRIHNGYGATTDIWYSTIQEIDLAVKDTAAAWQYHSPVVASVVTALVTQDSYHAGGNSNATAIEAPYQFKRKAQYFYQNPAYDRWSQSFAGFRKVVAHYGDEKATTATTYWFGPCQNNALRGQFPLAPLCVKGSDDDEYKSLTGRVVRMDRGTDFLNDVFGHFHHLTYWNISPQAERPKLLWTKTFRYSQAELFDRFDRDRRVTFSFPSQIDTYLYDDAQPTQPAGKISPIAGGDEVAGSDVLENAPHQKDIRKHLSRLVEYDERGTLKRVTDRGSVKDEDSKPSDVADATTITLFSAKGFWSDGPSGPEGTTAPLPCTSDWQCLPDYVSIWEPQPTLTGSDLARPLRKSRFTYTPTGDVQSVEGWLDDASESLERRRPAGDNSTAPTPAGQSLDRGWHTFATLS